MKNNITYHPILSLSALLALQLAQLAGHSPHICRNRRRDRSVKSLGQPDQLQLDRGQLLGAAPRLAFKDDD